MADTYQILVVDDDFSIVNIIETALKQAGYQVLTAHDGEAACHIVNTKHPHLIIMDVMMPQCNGIIATMRIRQNNNVPILMSDYQYQHDIFFQYTFGSNAFLLYLTVVIWQT